MFILARGEISFPILWIFLKSILRRSVEANWARQAITKLMQLMKEFETIPNEVLEILPKVDLEGEILDELLHYKRACSYIIDKLNENIIHFERALEKGKTSRMTRRLSQSLNKDLPLPSYLYEGKDIRTKAAALETVTICDSSSENSDEEIHGTLKPPSEVGKLQKIINKAVGTECQTVQEGLHLLECLTGEPLKNRGNAKLLFEEVTSRWLTRGRIKE